MNSKDNRRAADIYPGADISGSAKEATRKEVKEQLGELNNNPNNSSDEMPSAEPGAGQWVQDDQL